MPEKLSGIHKLYQTTPPAQTSSSSNQIEQGRQGYDEAIQNSSKQEVKQQPVVAEKRIGRNDTCPCGSGKKYKQCHGK